MNAPTQHRPILALAAAVLGSAPVAAQETAAAYPSRAITLIVQFAPGGPTDLIARTVGQWMSDSLGKPVVIENRPGGGSSIGTAGVAKAAPDGYTLGSVDMSLTVMPLIMANLSYDPLKDLIPISQTAKTPMTIVVAPNLGLNTAKEVVEFAKAKPDELKFAHSGVGSAPHLAALSFLQATKTSMPLVTYRGAGPAVQDIVAGHVSMLVTAPSTTVELTRAGKVRMIGVTGAQRLSALPEVPTMTEQGIELEGLQDGIFFGMAAPAGTRPDIIAKLNAVVNKAVLDEAVRKKLAAVDITAQGSTQDAFSQMIVRQSAVWKATLERAGIKPQ